MSDAQSRPAEQIRPIETVATGKVDEEHADQTAAEKPRTSALETEGASTFAGEIRPPDRPTLALPVAPRGIRGRRVWLVTGALVLTAGLGWIGGSNSYHLLDLEPTWPALQEKVNSSIRTVASRFQRVWNE